MITLPFLRQIMETGLEAVKAQSKRAGLPNATVTLEGGVVNTGSRKKGRGSDWNTTIVHDDVTFIARPRNEARPTIRGLTCFEQ